jgi:UDP-glucose 4-epimerase
LETITGRKIERVVLDVTDKAALNELFKQHRFFAVLHLAALKAVGESVAMPLEYYRVNVGGTINVLEVVLI